MSDFYGKIKTLDDCLYFTFITGVTKFSRMGVFSTLNNLVDISLWPEFASIAGFTHDELERNFQPHIKAAAARLHLDEDALLARMRDYYDGFSFDGQIRLYNPYSTLYFFLEVKFNNFWMESGSNTLIREMLKDKALITEQFRGLKVSEAFARYPGEIDQTPPEGFLYQAGYLTLRKDPETEFLMLDYPNYEVSASIAKLFIDNIFQSERSAYEATIELIADIKKINIFGIIESFIRLYASLPYDDYRSKMKVNISFTMLNSMNSEIKQLLVKKLGGNYVNEIIKQMQDEFNKREKVGKVLEEEKWGKIKSLMESLLEASGQADLITSKTSEGFYRATLLSYLSGAGLRVLAELHTNRGRSDLVIEHEDKSYVIELKVVGKFKEAEAAARDAIDQIMGKGCGGRYRDPVLIGLAISEEERNISACFCMRSGEIEKLEIKRRPAMALERDEPSGQAEAPGQPARPRGPRP
jgi:hypothetical protein